MAPSPAPNSFLEITRSLRLYVPQLPVSLAEQFIRDRYRKIVDRKDWGALRAESEFHLNAQKNDGTVAVTRNSDAVVGTGTSFASTDVGRQFKAGTGSPVYTVTVVTDTTHLTLDRTIGINTQSGLTYTLFDGYVVPPDNFLRFMVVSDPLQAWRLRHWITQDELMAWDPQRTFFGQPYAIVDRMFTATGNPQFEAWPYSTAARTLYYIYIKRPPDLTQDADVPFWPMRSDVLVKGALADAAKWPGTADSPNPYFANPAYWKAYEAEFEDLLVDLERRDEEIYMTYLSSRPWAQFPFAPMSAAYIQQHAI